MTNRLYYGDNLEVLRGEIADASVDLVYLDPPFNSNASYNILFKSQSGGGADASIEAFDDTWQWGPAASTALIEITQSGNHKLHTLMQAMKTAIGENAMMAYLAMMAVRLVELHRVLKPTGSLYLHCDPTASHYLKLVLDAVFGVENFRNEIVWERTNSHNMKTLGWTRSNDVIFFYTKSAQYTFNMQYKEYGPEQLKRFRPDEDGRLYKAENMTFSSANPSRQFEWRGTKPPENRSWGASLEQLEKWWAEGRILTRRDGSPRMDGLKIYLDETKGKPIGTNWTDIQRVGNTSGERLGYPTQKPLTLLERIISASSNPGDVVLDPFCGCGTAVDAAQKLGRRWIGIDVTHLAIGLVEKRLREGYGDAARFETIGVPKDKDSALRLAAEKPHEFQNWFCLHVGGYPLDGGRKGADKGIDGHFYPYETASTTATGVISVKAGQNIGVAMIRDLRGVMERDGYQYGLFLSAYEPTRAMQAEAAAAGVHETQFGAFPRIQILTPADIFHGPGAKLPPLAPINRRAARVETRASHKPGAQGSLL
ncbi:MAG TPA: DNA methyltransferase [Sphingomonas sp.]|nr:DNA methyltransferase [Sphingomonas sp.]